MSSSTEIDRTRDSQHDRVERRIGEHAPAFGRLSATGVVDQDAAHGLRGDREEVAAVLPREVLLPFQAQIGLVNQCGGLQAVGGSFATSVGSRNLAQRGVDGGKEPLVRSRLAGAPRSEETGNLPVRCMCQRELLLDRSSAVAHATA